MRAVVQRVTRARVTVADEVAGEIGPGLLALVGVGRTDDAADARWLAGKLHTLRVFPDNSGVMNRDVREANGQIMVVSQFTLFGDARKGRRPSYIDAAPPEIAETLYRAVIDELRAAGADVAEGIFRTDMLVELANDGPVTILLDSARTF